MGAPVAVLGLDPGSQVTGFGVVREASGRAELIAVGTIRTPSGGDMAERLGVIYTRVAEIIKLHQPNEAAIESVFVQTSETRSWRFADSSTRRIAGGRIVSPTMSGVTAANMPAKREFRKTLGE